MKRIYFFLGVLTVLIGISACDHDIADEVNSPQQQELLSQSSEESTSLNQEGFLSISVKSTHTIYDCDGGETVALIQDVPPWGTASGLDSLGSNVTELLAQGIDFCIIHSSELGVVDLLPYHIIIIASAQTSLFYNNLFPGGNVHPDIEDFVDRGGILSANLCDLNAANWEGNQFVGGLQETRSHTQDNDIQAYDHPIITGECGAVNGGLIVDTAPLNDLDNWNWASHAYFTNLPASSVVILSDGVGRPVMIEYPYGNGRVIASLTTTEWRYLGFNNVQEKKLLANDICYQIAISFLNVEFDIKPQSCPNPFNTKAKGVLPVAILGTENFDVNDIDLSSIELEGANPIKSSLEDVGTPVLDGLEECDCTTAGADGFMDLSLKFDRQELVTAMGELNDGDVVVMTISGNLLDGRRFKGKDCLIIIKKK